MSVTEKARCEIEGCTRVQAINSGRAYRFCDKHRFKRNRPPEYRNVPRRTKSAVERFWPLVSKSEGCWLWSGFVNSHGYGVFYIREAQKVSAHRFSYELANGPCDLLVLHKCDVRHCVRPDHLFAGSAKDNSQDMISKGRAHWQRAA